MLNLLLTYDYELFFNKSFASEKDVLIEPAYEIAKGLSNEGVGATFFVDTPSVIAYKKLGLDEYPSMVKKQVNYFLETNHDVQLHIHPIWYKSEYKDGEWEFNNDYYALKAFSNVEEIIKESKACLDELVEGNPHYLCCAFRAGGFCYNPEKEITLTLLKLGIKIDSTVCKGLMKDTLAQEFNFKKTPAEDNWFFGQNGVLTKTTEKVGLFEIPIGTYKYVPHKWILTHCMPKLPLPPRKGLSTPVTRSRKMTILDRINLSINTPVLFTCDSLHAKALLAIVKHYERRAADKDIYISIIAHPKISSDVCVANTVSFVQMVKKSCHNTRFVTMKDVVNIENL